MAKPEGHGMILRKSDKAAQPSVRCFSKEYEKKYLPTWATDAKKCTSAFKHKCSFEEAIKHCYELGPFKCSGVTQENGSFTVRKEYGLRDSSGNSNSWMIDDCQAQVTDSEETWDVVFTKRQTDKKCLAPVGFLGKLGTKACANKVTELGGEFFQMNDEMRCELLHTTSTACPEGLVNTDKWDTYQVGKKANVQTIEPECNPNQCAYGKLSCYSETGLYKCGTDILSTDPAIRTQQMNIDCSSEPDSTFCNGQSIWDDCKVGNDKFSHRLACPLGTWTCGNRSCWESSSHCTARGGVLYGPEACSPTVKNQRLLFLQAMHPGY